MRPLLGLTIPPSRLRLINTMQVFHIRIAGDDLIFSAAHFITLDAENCEPLHGHDYRVAAEVYGPLGEEHYVVDFVAVRDALRGILAEMDHRVLLPTSHPTIRVTADPEQVPEQVTVTFAERRWVFPRGDCLLMPIPSTTSELLARHVAARLLNELQSRCGRRPPRLRIEIRESCGFSAVCELRDE